MKTIYLIYWLWAFYIYISGWKLSPTNYNECHVIFKQSVNQSSVTDSRPIKVFLFPSQPIRMTQFHSSNRSGVFCIHVEGKFNSTALSYSPNVHAQTVCSDLSNEVDLIAKAHIANGWISSTLKAKPNCFLRGFYEAIRYCVYLHVMSIYSKFYIYWHEYWI